MYAFETKFRNSNVPENSFLEFVFLQEAFEEVVDHIRLAFMSKFGKVLG